MTFINGQAKNKNNALNTCKEGYYQKIKIKIYITFKINIKIILWKNIAVNVHIFHNP